ncbi:hypothetical protein [Desulfogranum mediterraneum]|uniref:hypothetical protein n=1 Tax=Desulfogranum mediterraneum TaxID=160661 RepID=UPI0012947E2B|nr:hypothetical protein [Desulfogranum mediterraneum]
MKSRDLRVVECLDRWQVPDHCYLKVRADDGARSIIRHHVAAGHRQGAMFERSR